MIKASRDFQVFAKPIGSICNLDCHYCYYLKKENLYPGTSSFRMEEDILEEYIRQHIDACPEDEIRFSWHGGEPTLLGLDYFRNIVDIQNKYKPSGKRILNGIQTNATLLDDDWCSFFKKKDFSIGLSLDGPRELHDKYRLTKGQKPTFDQTMRGYDIMRKHKVIFDVLCVVNSFNVRHPLEVYRFFKELHATYISFLPLVETDPGSENGVNGRTVPAEQFGDFLCTVFDEWVEKDIGKIKVQIFEEAARTAFGQDHSLCIFRETCGDIPVVEHNGDFYSCDHFVDPEYHVGNIRETPLVELLESGAQRKFGNDKKDTLPRYCRECEVLDMCNGGCPKNRFINTPDGEPGLNYLCAGYKKFFNHCKPFVTEVAAAWHMQNREQERQTEPVVVEHPVRKIGRNDLCPCGSGKKYKHCCLSN